VLREICAETMAIVARLLAQKSDDKRKLYALHGKRCFSTVARGA
jgi:hypothetical protein